MMYPDGTLVVVAATGERGTVCGFVHRTYTHTRARGGELILLVEHAPGRVCRYAAGQLTPVTPELDR